MDGKTIILQHSEQHYRTIFNQINGFFARIEDFGFSEPNWAQDGPELLDISITNYCEKGCSFCYRRSSSKGKHIPKEKLLPILDQCRDLKVLQIALGGGNPNQHPDFISILHEIRKRDIIPSYTTNGQGLSEEILKVSAEYCGAIGISAYPPYDSLEETIIRVASYGIRINLHIILSNFNIPVILRWLTSPPRWFNQLNAIIFLNYKPINKTLPSEDIDDNILAEFYALVESSGIKIGFDCCSTSGILKWLKSPSYFIESCEAARFSAFISEELKMYPCSFMADTENFGDLRENTIYEIWHNNRAFIEMRNDSLEGACSSCAVKGQCKGGCKFLPQINLCKNNPLSAK